MANHRNFRHLLEHQWSRGNFVCVGLDPVLDKIPELLKNTHVANTLIAFNRAIVDATKDLVCAYKPNTAFYEAYGSEGLVALHQTILDIHTLAPDVPVILDAKRADIGHTNQGYVDAAFHFLKADAITVHPYLGFEALQPFLAHPEKGIIVLCRTSNRGANEFQDLCINGIPLYRMVAEHVATQWNKHGNCALVVGATCPKELREVRAVVGDMSILIPGIGAQGGDIKEVVLAGKNSLGQGFIVNASRSIIFASKNADFAEAARKETQKLRELINVFR